jgi:hypothetical protein
MFAALNQPVPPELERGRGGFAGRGRPTGARGGQPGEGAPAGASGASQAPAGQRQGTQPGRPEAGAPNGPAARGDGSGARPQGRGGFDPNMTPEERRKRLEERMATMSPEDRERFAARMREGGFGGRGSGPGDRPGAAGATRQGAPGTTAQRQGARDGSQADAAQSRTMASGATTIDSLFGPLPTVESRGTAWIYDNKQLKMLRLRLGITDQTYTEILNPEDVPEGTEVVVNMTTGLESRTSTPGQTPGQNPLMGPQRGNRGGGRGGRG